MLLLFSLLFVNGGLIVAGMIALIAEGALASEDSSNITHYWPYSSNEGNSNRARRMGCGQKTTRYKEKRQAQK